MAPKFLLLHVALDLSKECFSPLIEDCLSAMSSITDKSYRCGKQTIIGDIIKQVSERNKGNCCRLVLSVSNQFGFVEQSEQFENRMVASNDMSNYKIVRNNDFAYNPARINVGSIARLSSDNEGVVSPMYICFHTKPEVDSEFLEHFFETTYFKYEMIKRLEGSVRQCLSFDAICNISINVPSLENQKNISQKISSFISKINVEQNYIDLLVSQKQYLLQQMFI